MTPADLIAHANGSAQLPTPALEAAAFILHLMEHGYGDDQAEDAYRHWSGYPEKIRQGGHDDAARVLRAAIGAAGLVVIPAELLEALTDSDDCWFDHHGGCQAHGFLSLEPGERCPHAEAREILAALPERTDQ